MEAKKEKESQLIIIMMTVIIGIGLYKQFDFTTLTFKNIPLSILYAVVLVVAIYLIIRNFLKNRVR
jgi:hypothetical protein